MRALTLLGVFAGLLWGAASASAQTDGIKSTTYVGEIRPITDPIHLRIGEIPPHRFVMTTGMAMVAPKKPLEKPMPLRVAEGKLAVVSSPSGLTFRMDFDNLAFGDQKLKANAPLSRLSATITPSGEIGDVDGDFPGLAELGLPGKGSAMADNMIQRLRDMPMRYAPVIRKAGDPLTDESPQELLARGIDAAEQQGIDLDLTMEASGGSYAVGLTTFRGIEALVAQTDVKMRMRTNDGTMTIDLTGYSLTDLRNGNTLDMIREMRLGMADMGSPFDVVMYTIMEFEPLPDGGI